MLRTSLLIPDKLKFSLERVAAKEQVSLGELIRRALEKYLLSRQGPIAHDPFLSSQTVFHDKGRRDVSEKHDRLLLERGPH